MKCSITIMAGAIACALSCSETALAQSSLTTTTGHTPIRVLEVVEQPAAATTAGRSHHSYRHHRHHRSSRKSATTSPKKDIIPSPPPRPFALGRMTWQERWQGLADHAAFFDLNPLSTTEWVETRPDTIAEKTAKPKTQERILSQSETAPIVRSIPLTPDYPPKTDMRNMLALVLGSGCIAFGLFRTPKFLERRVFS